MILISSKPTLGLAAELLPGFNRTFTLTTYLGEFLTELEAIFGPRDKNWTILGIEFFPNRPHIWYPGNRDHVAISLSEEARLEPNRALWQLAHEAVHLLSPTGKQDGLLIEEGLAALYADLKSQQLGLGFDHNTTEYQRPASYTKSLLTFDKESIMKIRSVEPCFSRLTPNILLKALPQIDFTLASNLCTPFHYDA